MTASMFHETVQQYKGLRVQWHWCSSVQLSAASHYTCVVFSKHATHFLHNCFSFPLDEDKGADAVIWAD